jgi:dihydropteroate synthase
VDPSRIILDPGIGFGKRVEHNLMILRHLGRFVDLGHPVLVGASRKRFIGTVLGINEPKQREPGSLACATIAAMAGVAILRVHDVRSTVEAIRLCTAVRSADGTVDDRPLGSRID